MLGTLQAGLMGGATFNPLQIAGLVLWLDASTGITQSGGTVSAWNDQSGNGNNAAQATGGLQPAFTSSAINGLPGVTFGPANVRMEGSANLVPSFNARTVFAVVKSTSDQMGSLFTFRKTNPYWCAQPLSFLTANVGYNTYTDGAVVNATVAENPTPTLANTPTVFEWSHPTGGTTPPYFAINGLSRTTSGNVTSDTGTTGWILGLREIAQGTPFPGTICAVLVYNTELSVSDKSAVRNYLGARYAISVLS